MFLEKRARRTNASTDDSLIPMINVVFLLLVFFMVAGTIEPPDPFQVEPPESDKVNESHAQNIVYLASNGLLALNGEILLDADLDQALQALAEGTDATLADNTAERLNENASENQALGLQLDAGVTFKQLRALVKSLLAAGFTEVELITSMKSSVTD